MATEQVIQRYNLYVHLVGSDDRPLVDVYVKGFTDEAPRLHVSLGHLLALKEEVPATSEFLVSSTARVMSETGTIIPNIIRLSRGDVAVTGYGHEEED